MWTAEAELSRGGQRERHTACTTFMMTRGGGYRRGLGPSLRFLDTEFGVSAPALCLSSVLAAFCSLLCSELRSFILLSSHTHTHRFFIALMLRFSFVLVAL